VTSSGVHYLYYLSDTDVGLYLSVSGESGGDVAAALMDLAESIVADPTLSAVKDDI
jgi:hypothetical protein